MCRELIQEGPENPMQAIRRILKSRMFRPLRVLLTLIVAGASVAPMVAAQSSVPTGPQGRVERPGQPVYDVSSVKPNKSGSGNWNIDQNLNTFVATNVTLVNLLQEAFGIRRDLISGGPAWVDSARFDIVAKIVSASPEDLHHLSEDQTRSMVQAMLVEHFKIQTHPETKMLAVYDLVLAAGKPRFEQSQADGKEEGIQIENTQLTAHGATLALIADALSPQVQRTVIDKTGLTAKYDLNLKWSSDAVLAANQESAGSPSIFTALPEQLGLKLQASRGPVQTLVIDHAELPAEN